MRELLYRMAEITGHTIVAEAVDVDTANDVIDDVEFDVAVVDGNLEGSKDFSCEDGKAVVNAIRSRRQGAKIIWFSSIRLPQAEVGYDFDSGKDVVSVMEAIGAI